MLTFAWIEFSGVQSSWQTEASIKWKYFSLAFDSSSILTLVVSMNNMINEIWFLNMIHWVCTLNCHLSSPYIISILAEQFPESMNKHSSYYLSINQDKEISSGPCNPPSDSQIS